MVILFIVFLATYWHKFCLHWEPFRQAVKPGIKVRCILCQGEVLKTFFIFSSYFTQHFDISCNPDVHSPPEDLPVGWIIVCLFFSSVFHRRCAVVPPNWGRLALRATYSRGWPLARSHKMCCGAPLGLCRSHLFHKSLCPTRSRVPASWLHSATVYGLVLPRWQIDPQNVQRLQHSTDLLFCSCNNWKWAFLVSGLLFSHGDLENQAASILRLCYPPGPCCHWHPVREVGSQSVARATLLPEGLGSEVVHVTPVPILGRTQSRGHTSCQES